MKYKKWLEKMRLRREKMYALLDSGWTQSDISRKFKISRTRVNQIVKERGT